MNIWQTDADRSSFENGRLAVPGRRRTGSRPTHLRESSSVGFLKIHAHCGQHTVPVTGDRLPI